MLKLDSAQYQQVFDFYKSTNSFFPLIGAVLLNHQDGVVYVDNSDAPKQVYVEHVFGFSQIFGDPVIAFEACLEHYLLLEKQFAAPKVRLYGTYLPDFLRGAQYEPMRSIRQRFSIKPESEKKINVLGEGAHGELEARRVDVDDVGELERLFGVVSRFWRSPEAFVNNANAVAVYHRGKLAGVCYAAAEANSCVEIDVSTLPLYRNLGVGTLAVTRFVDQCYKQSLQPLWDCFTNNEGSMRLCSSTGFLAVNAPYPFFTFNKHC